MANLKTWTTFAGILLQFTLFWSALISVQGLKLPDDYDRALRPNNDAVSDYIKVTVQVSSIRQVNKDDVTVDLILKSQWVDPRLSGIVKNREQIFSNKLPEVWLPDLYIIEAISSSQPEGHSSTMKLLSDGSINHIERLAVKLSCQMTYKKFPFDKQTCPLTIRSFGYTRVHLDLIWHGTVNEDVTVFDSEFSLSSMDQSSRNLRTKEGEYSQLTLSFNLSRCGLRLAFKVILPALVFGLISYMTLFLGMPTAKTAGEDARKDAVTAVHTAQLTINLTRLALNSLSILVLVMISQTSSLGSPASATVTAVDVWISVVYIIILIAFIFSLLRIMQNLRNSSASLFLVNQSESSQTELSQKSRSGGKSLLERVEQYFKISIPIVFLVFAIIYCAVYLS